MMISPDKAVEILLILLILISIFHILILVKIIPYTITWGGRLKNDKEMYVFELVSISVNAFLIWVLLMAGKFVNFQFPALALGIILWIFFALFCLNTLGNLLAKSNFEKTFALLTAFIAFLIWQILMAINY